jgi:hypothetical protein
MGPNERFFALRERRDTARLSLRRKGYKSKLTPRLRFALADIFGQSEVALLQEILAEAKD